MSELKKLSEITPGADQRYEVKQIWDHENRCWVESTEENIERLWLKPTGRIEE